MFNRSVIKDFCLEFDTVPSNFFLAPANVKRKKALRTIRKTFYLPKILPKAAGYTYVFFRILNLGHGTPLFFKK